MTFGIIILLLVSLPISKHDVIEEPDYEVETSLSNSSWSSDRSDIWKLYHQKQHLDKIPHEFVMNRIRECVHTCLANQGCYLSELECFCDASCHWFNDCCNSHMIPKRNESLVMNRLLNHTTCEIQNQNSSSCYMVSSCPNEWTDIDVRAKCENYTHERYAEMTPVVVESNENLPVTTHFVNRYCARCHGYSDFVPWSGTLNTETCDTFAILNLLIYGQVDLEKILMTERLGCVVHFADATYSCRKCDHALIEMPPVSLDILFNFIEDETQQLSSCMEPNVSVPVCEEFEMLKDGSCTRIIRHSAETYISKLVYQIADVITLAEAELSAKEFMNFVFYGVEETYRMLTDQVIPRWTVTAIPGYVKGTREPCTEIHLDIMFHLYHLSEEKVQSIMLTPCLELPCPVTFLPFNHSQRKRFCDTSICNMHLISESDVNEVEDFEQWLKTILTISVLCLSAIALFISMVIFIACPLFHNLPGRIHLNLFFVMLSSNVVFLFSSQVLEGTLGCLIVGVVTHYFWLSVFCWMSVCSFHAWLVFRSRMLPTKEDPVDTRKRLWRYCVVGFLFPVPVVVGCLIVDLLCSDCGIHYGKSVCFISDPIGIAIGFAGPVGVLIFLNIILFAATIRNIQTVNRLANNRFDSQRSNFVIYVKLSTLMGLCWTFEFLNEFLSLRWFSYLSTLINGLQGVFIFISFVLNKNVLKWFRESNGKCQEISTKSISKENRRAAGPYIINRLGKN